MALAPAHPGPPGSPEGALREAQALSPLPAAPGPPTPARRPAGLAPGQDDDPLPLTVRGQSRGSERAQGHRSPVGAAASATEGHPEGEQNSHSYGRKRTVTSSLPPREGGAVSSGQPVGLSPPCHPVRPSSPR